MLGSFRKSSLDLAVFQRLRGWTRARFALGAADPVVITEQKTRLPGFPPVETIVAFWDPADETTRYHFKVFKPAAEVVEDDLPPAWLKPGLVDTGVAGCSCC